MISVIPVKINRIKTIMAKTLNSANPVHQLSLLTAYIPNAKTEEVNAVNNELLKVSKTSAFSSRFSFLFLYFKLTSIG